MLNKVFLFLLLFFVFLTNVNATENCCQSGLYPVSQPLPSPNNWNVPAWSFDRQTIPDTECPSGSPDSRLGSFYYIHDYKTNTRIVNYNDGTSETEYQLSSIVSHVYQCQSSCVAPNYVDSDGICRDPSSGCPDNYTDINGTCVLDCPDQYSDINGTCVPDCPDHLDCIGSIQEAGDSTWVNSYNVIDCHGVNYATRDLTEGFNCVDSDDHCKNTDVNSHTGINGICVCNNGFIYGGYERCVPGNPDNHSDDNSSDTGDGSSDDNCDYPLIYKGFHFQGLVFFRSTCVDDIMFYANGNGSAYQLDSCEQWGCYYNVPDNNSSNPNNGDGDNNATGSLDNNSSDPDNNASNNLDLKPALIRLDKINKSVNLANRSLGSKLSDLNKNVKNNTDVLSNDIDQLKKQNIVNAGGIVDSVHHNTDVLGNKLDDIKDLLKGNNDSDKTSDDNSSDNNYNSEFNKLNNLKDNAFASFESSKNDLISLANGFTPPQMHTSGSCVISAHVMGRDITFDMSIFATFRPYIQFTLNIFLLYWTLKFYTIIARDITQYFLGGN